MWFFNQTSPATRISLAYITTGALVVVWTVIWFLYLFNNPPERTGVYYLVTGFFITGLTLLGIGFGLGQIGRASRPADDVPHQPVPAVTPTVPQTPVVPVNNGNVAPTLTPAQPAPPAQPTMPVGR